MKKELLFYNVTRFDDLKSYYNGLGMGIETITEVILDNTWLENKFDFEIVIDISSLCSLKENLQINAEKILSLFNDSFTFIIDERYRNEVINELRFCFEKFVDFERFLEVESTEIIINEKKHNRIIDLDDQSREVFLERFESSLYGHSKFKDDFRDLVNNFVIFNKLGEHKILSLFLMGDSGVGKTEVARAIHKSLNGKRRIAKVNFGNYSSKDALNSLIGSPRGFIGSEDGEIFMQVAGSDTGVILIDEFEKSDATLFNYFLDVLENGKMVSSLGKEIDLNGFIIIFTSNISKDNFKTAISPELRSRFDYKCYFSVLKDKDKLKYVEFRINNIVDKFNKHIANSLDSEFIHHLISEINVSKYTNMRDINKQIRKVFVQRVLEQRVVNDQKTGIYKVEGKNLIEIEQTPGNGSINSIIDYLGYPRNHIKTVHTFDSNRFDCLGFKSLSKELVFVLTKDKETIPSFSDVSKEINKIDWDFEYSSHDVEDILNDGIDAKNLGVIFLTTVISDFQFIDNKTYKSNKLGLLFFFEDNILTDFCSSGFDNASTKWLKKWNPSMYKRMLKEAKLYHENEQDAMREMNILSDSLRGIPQAIRNEFIHLHKKKNKNINFYNLLITHYSQDCTLDEFIFINKGRYKKIDVNSFEVGYFIYEFDDKNKLISVYDKKTK